MIATSGHAVSVFVPIVANPASTGPMSELLPACFPVYSALNEWATQQGESMTKEAFDFLGLHGELLVDRLKRDILAALESEDDTRALHLDGLLKKIEEISKVEAQLGTI